MFGVRVECIAFLINDNSNLSNSTINPAIKFIHNQLVVIFLSFHRYAECKRQKEHTKNKNMYFHGKLSFANEFLFILFCLLKSNISRISWIGNDFHLKLMIQLSYVCKSFSFQIISFYMYQMFLFTDNKQKLITWHCLMHQWHHNMRSCDICNIFFFL